MHEIRIAEDLTGIVLDAAAQEGLSEVSVVNVSFGQLVQVVPDIFRFAFREAVRDTIARNAELNIEIIPVKMSCINCDHVFYLKENYFICENCGSADIDILQGKEMYVKSIEGE